MDFAEQIFREEVRQKKSIGYSARKRICGSKSKRAATLPSDSLTLKQWKEKNGPVNTYNLSSPMSWHMFNSMPSELQKMYLQKLIDAYHVTCTAVAQMFGVSKNYALKSLGTRGLSGLFSKGRRMTEQQIEEFERFCRGERSLPAPRAAAPATDQTAVLELQDAEPTPELPQSDSAMHMSEVSAIFEGKINLTEIMNTLRYMIPDGKNGRVYIVVNLEGKV